MKAEIKNINGTSRLVKIEVSSQELNREFDQVYADMRKFARVPGFRAGHAPRDLLETHYGKKAQEEVIKRAIPEYYLKAVKQESLVPVAPPEIEDVQFKNHTLMFSAKVDVRPRVKLKAYKSLKVTKKKINIEQAQVAETLERLRQSRAKEKVKPDLNDAFAQELGFKTLDELKEALNKNLQANAEIEINTDMERQVIDELLKRNSLDVPESLVNSETRELLSQLKMNRILQGENKEDVEAKEKELKEQARSQAVQRVKLSFILEEIGQQENIQVESQDLEKRIEAIAQRSGKNKDEVKQYLERENLIPGLKGELRNKKAMELLLREAKVAEEK